MNDSVRIIQVIPTIAENFGGPAIGALELNRELRRGGIDARILTTGLALADGSTMDESQLDIIHANGSSVGVFAPSRPFRVQGSWTMLTAVFREARSSDLIHIDGQYLLPHVYAYWAARRWKVRYGVQPHGTTEPYQRRQSRLKKWVYNALVGRAILKNASYVIFAAESEADRASDITRPDQRVVVPLGAVLPPEMPMVGEIATRISSTDREKVVLFLGRLAHKKRPDLLIQAWARVDRPDGALLVMAGPDDNWTASDLAAIAERLGVASSVVFTGLVSGPQKTWLYSRSGIFALPSENENFGISLGEAMLGGCHVVCSDSVASSSFLTLANSGMILTDMTEHSLAEALESALADPAEQKLSGERAQMIAAEHLTWKPLATILITEANKSKP